MDGIFSHADPTPTPDDGPDGPRGRSGPGPVVATVTVPMESDQAFEGFVDYLHLWWPLGTVSAIGPGSHVGFESGALVEESDTGERSQWATVLRADPPMPNAPANPTVGVIELDFTLGHEDQPPTRVTVEFQETGTGATDVTVTHSGWAAGTPGEQQHQTAEAWPEILGYYQRFMGGRA